MNNSVVTEPASARSSNPMPRYFAATQPVFLSATLVACWLGLAGATTSGVSFQPATVAFTLLFALLLIIVMLWEMP